MTKILLFLNMISEALRSAFLLPGLSTRCLRNQQMKQANPATVKQNAGRRIKHIPDSCAAQKLNTLTSTWPGTRRQVRLAFWWNLPFKIQFMHTEVIQFCKVLSICPKRDELQWACFTPRFQVWKLQTGCSRYYGRCSEMQKSGLHFAFGTGCKVRT